MPTGQYADWIARNEILASPVFFTGRHRYHELLSLVEAEMAIQFSQEQRIHIVEKLVMESGLIVLEVISFWILYKILFILLNKWHGGIRI